MAVIKVTEDMIVNAASSWQVEHADAPTELELHRLRASIGKNVNGDIHMLSLHWLRNQFVKLRKKHGLTTIKPQKNLELF